MVGRARQVATWGFMPISWQEIDAWARRMKLDPKTWEIDALLRLDRVWLSVMAEKGHPFEDADDSNDHQPRRRVVPPPRAPTTPPRLGISQQR
jgi:hypothetical protein